MMKRFEIEESPLSGLFHLIPNPMADNRGYFERLYCQETFKALGVTKDIVTINHSYTEKKGAIRGLHFQYPPYTENKIILCIKGSVYDVAVDIRKNSPSFLQWHAQILHADRRNMLLLPEGFAHGFQTLEPQSELLYLHTETYHPENEGGLAYDDPVIGIKWVGHPTDISLKDQTHLHITAGFKGI
jgi:dTDP-4-dehydrorhamnose 3,5-epimerase